MTTQHAYWIVFALGCTWLAIVEIRRVRRDRAATLRTYDAASRLMSQHGNRKWRVGRTG